MTALPNVPGTLKLQFKFTYGTDATVYTHLYCGELVGGPPATGDFQTFVNAIRSAYVTNCLSVQGNTCTLKEVTGTWLGDNTSAQVIATGTNPGSRAGTPNTASTCVLLNLKINRRYRGGHPRLYLPWGVSSDITTPQSWSTTFLTAAQTAANALISAVNTYAGAGFSGVTVVNVSYYNAGGLRVSPVVDVVTSTPVNSIPATQRRRLRP